ncbi:hypothetical protein GQ53DRAFT_50203 [Neofusicoccum parvum]|uniref:AA1-like domain-containing protein n=3 Tax=Neofusicoccum TaxID=407951 RepID=R1ELP2_BOTPV|nr:hypothetical protein UCRNP2_4531 [Neofusicoccum parvum UCRNP2]GME46069.1 hypothetical protein GQ53DRAFT_50203 [Neofusicoccum parvum]GME53342.1 hypothetical protein GQ53DRAFT_50203 [Neofusicoccum parvum]
MRLASTAAPLLSLAAAALAQDAFPFGYWNVNVTSARTDGGWVKNLTVAFVDDARDVAQEGTDFHCSSAWTGATLTEVKHCDDWTLDFDVSKALGRPDYVELTQSVSWGSGKFVSGATVWGSADVAMSCAADDELNCDGFVKVNATNRSF